MTLSFANSKSLIVTTLRFLARREERSFIDEIRQIRAREAGRTAGQNLQLHVLSQRDLRV